MAGVEESAWLLVLKKQVRKRNLRASQPFEQIILDVHEAQRVADDKTNELEVIRQQKNELQKQIRNGVGVEGGVSPQVLKELEDKVKDLEEQQRRWAGDARVIIDTQKEKQELQETVGFLQADNENLRQEAERLMMYEREHKVLTDETDMLRAEHIQLRDDHEKVMTEKKTHFDENMRLTESAMKAKLELAEKMNEVMDLEKRVKDLMDQIKTGGAQVVEAKQGANTADAPSSSSSMRVDTAQRQPAPVPNQLAKKKPNCHQHDVNAVEVSPQSTVFATGSSDKIVKLWDLQTFDEKAQLRGAVSAVVRLGFNTTGDILVGGTSDGSAVVWNVQTCRHMFSLCGHTAKITGICFGDEKTLLTCSGDRTIRKWDIQRSGACTKTTMCWSNCTDLATGGGGVITSSHYDGGLRFWDTRTVNNIEELKGAHTQAVTSVSFSQCGNKVLSTSKEGAFKIWDIRNYSEICRVPIFDYNSMLSTHKACFGRDDQLIAIGVLTDTTRGVVQVYNSIGKPRVRSTLADGHENQISQVSWAPDGSVLISAGLDGSIVGWQ